jgi:multiple sugar transport system permease protein
MKESLHHSENGLRGESIMNTRVNTANVTVYHEARKRKRSTTERREETMFWVFISPWVIGFLFFAGGPILASLLLSFSEYNVTAPPKFAGLQNFIGLFHDRLFYKSLYVTCYYTALAVPFNITIALLLAVLLNQKVKAQAFFRTIFYAPTVVSGVAISFLWAWLLNPQFGVVNYLLAYFSITGPMWFNSGSTVIPSIVLTTLTSIGGTMIIFLASLQTLPMDLYEVAAIDGASKTRQFFKITIPMLSPVILFNVIIGMIGSFQVFTQAFIITKGGPDWNSYFYVYYLFDTAFSQFRLGYASAQAWILFLIIFGLTLLALKVSKRYVHY